MQKLQKLQLNYIGIAEPETTDEVELEILGLETAMSAAAQRIAVLKQSLRMQELMNKNKEGMSDDQTVEETQAEETKQEG